MAVAVVAVAVVGSTASLPAANSRDAQSFSFLNGLLWGCCSGCHFRRLIPFQPARNVERQQREEGMDPRCGDERPRTVKAKHHASKREVDGLRHDDAVKDESDAVLEEGRPKRVDHDDEQRDARDDVEEADQKM